MISASLLNTRRSCTSGVSGFRAEGDIEERGPVFVVSDEEERDARKRPKIPGMVLPFEVEEAERGMLV